MKCELGALEMTDTSFQIYFFFPSNLITATTPAYHLLPFISCILPIIFLDICDIDVFFLAVVHNTDHVPNHRIIPGQVLSSFSLRILSGRIRSPNLHQDREGF